MLFYSKKTFAFFHLIEEFCMRCKKLMFVVLILTVIIVSRHEVSAQQKETTAAPVAENTETPAQTKCMPNIYGHVFGGIGFSYLSANDVKDVVGDDWGVGIGLPTWSYGVRAGFRNIVQVEYNIGKAHHDLNGTGYKAVPIGEPGYAEENNDVIKMDYDTSDIQFKLNPKFWKHTTNSSGYTKAFFLVYGFGDVEWRDRVDDGFEGKSTIYGIEYALISKNVSLSVSFKRYEIAFDETTITYEATQEDITFDKSDAADYIFEIKVGVGLGM